MGMRKATFLPCRGPQQILPIGFVSIVTHVLREVTSLLDSQVCDFVLQLYSMFKDTVRVGADSPEGVSDGATPPAPRPAAAATPADVDELEILMRVRRIAQMSAQNASLLAAFSQTAEERTGSNAPALTLDGPITAVGALAAAMIGTPAADKGGSLANDLLEFEDDEADEDPVARDTPELIPPSATTTVHVPGPDAGVPSNAASEPAIGMRSNIEAFLNQAHAS